MVAAHVDAVAALLLPDLGHGVLVGVALDGVDDLSHGDVVLVQLVAVVVVAVALLGRAAVGVVGGNALTLSGLDAAGGGYSGFAVL